MPLTWWMFCVSFACSPEITADGKQGINGNLDKRLREFGTKLKSRNDPLIKQSKKVLWLSQGEVGWKKMIRGVLFWALEMDKKIRGERRLKKDMEVAKPA